MHSTLNINNRPAFDQAVFQTDTQFDSLKYNKWKDNAVKALQRIYNAIEDLEGIDTADYYIFGDIINLISDATIDADHRGETWTVTAGDFDKYDLSSLSEEEINDLIDRAAHIAQNDGMAYYYWEAIKEAAEEKGLTKINE